MLRKNKRREWGAVEAEYSRMYSKLKGQRMERLKLRVGKETPERSLERTEGAQQSRTFIMARGLNCVLKTMVSCRH